MKSHHFASSARVRCACILAMVFVWIGSVHAEPIFSVGAKEVIYSASKRKSKGNAWPDGNFGVISNGDGTYDFYAANSSKIKLTTGTLNDPAAKKKKKPKIYNVPKNTYKYLAGGPVYEDDVTGARFMVYHAEIHYGSKYSSLLGLAASTDGQAFWDLGPIIEPNIPVGQYPWSVDVGGGSFVVKDGYFNVYYRDYLADGSSSQLAVARAPLADVINNSLNGMSTQFTKYYNGSWSEPGRKGKSSPLESGNPPNWWSSVSYNEYLDQIVMVSSQWQAAGTLADLYLATSSDGVNWSTRQPIALDTGEQMYPTIIGTGPDPQRSGQSFYVYYTDGKRWGSAQLARRQVTFDPYVPPIDPPGGSGGDPPLMDWFAVSDYADDFRIGSPATGWAYAWNSTGALGNSASFSPLVWSDLAQAYNTTGAATRTPSGTTHVDDYLQLAATGGHPGRPGYLPIAGYTIQEDDGAGLYRIADSSIQKIDGTTSSMEDGLQVLVYRNDTLIGPAANVLTNGSLASFNRDLGELNVGDTIWVLVSAQSTQFYDAFKSFDFSLQRGVELVQTGLAAAAVPEPASASLMWLVIAACVMRRSKRER